MPAEMLAQSYKPVYRREYLTRLRVVTEATVDQPEDWLSFNDMIQPQFNELDRMVKQESSDIRSTPGATQGREFLLFSYRTFAGSSDIDPVVAGVTLRGSPDGIAIEADLSGEHTGDLIASVPCQVTSHDLDDVLAGVRSMIASLSNSTRAIAVALHDPARKID